MPKNPDWQQPLAGLKNASMPQTRRRAETLLKWAAQYRPPDEIIQQLNQHAQRNRRHMDQRIRQLQLPAWEIYDGTGRVRTKWKPLGKLCWIALALVHLSGSWKPTPSMANMLMGGLRLRQEYCMRKRLRKVKNTKTQAYLLQWLDAQAFQQTFQMVATQNPELASKALLRAKPYQLTTVGRAELEPILIHGTPRARRVALRLCGHDEKTAS